MSTHRKPYNPMSPVYTAVALAAVGFTSMVSIAGSWSGSSTPAAQTGARTLSTPALQPSPTPSQQPLIVGGDQVPLAGSAGTITPSPGAAPTATSRATGFTSAPGPVSGGGDSATSVITSATNPITVSTLLPTVVPSSPETSSPAVAPTTSAAPKGGSESGKSGDDTHGKSGDRGSGHHRKPTSHPTSVPTYVPPITPSHGSTPSHVPTPVPTAIPATDGHHWPIIITHPVPLRSLLPLLPSILTSMAGSLHHHRY